MDDPLPFDLPFRAALDVLRARHGVLEVDAYDARFADLFGIVGQLTNHDVGVGPWASSSASREVASMPAVSHRLAPPHLIGPRRSRAVFDGGVQEAPPSRLIAVQGGAVLRLSGIPVVLDGMTALSDLSGVHAPLLHCYDVDVAGRLAQAQRVEGPALLLMSEIGDGNYCHFLLDELPRLALTDDAGGLTVVICAIDEPGRNAVRHEALRLAGVRRVIELGPHEALRADTLLVPTATHDMHHPAFKGAPWACRWLRATIGVAALARQAPPEPEQRYATRLYVGRGDAASRRLVNENALLARLAPLGFVAVTMAGRSLIEQAALFARAEVIVGLHGAALANIVFCAPGTRLLEIYAPGFGNAAYGLMAAALAMPYASHVAEPGRMELEYDDTTLIVPAFWREAEPWLRAATRAAAQPVVP